MATSLPPVSSSFARDLQNIPELKPEKFDLYLSSNEAGSTHTLRLMREESITCSAKNADCKGIAIFATSGFFSVNLALARMAKLKKEYPHLRFYLVIVDLGKTGQVMKQVPDLLQRAPDTESFKSELDRLLLDCASESNPTIRAQDIDFLYRKNPSQGSYSLSAPKAYQDLKQLSEEGGLIVKSQNLADPKIMQAFRNALDENHIAVDTVYTSNVHHHLPDRERVLFQQSIDILAGNDNPLLINSQFYNKRLIVQRFSDDHDLSVFSPPLIQQVVRRGDISLEREVTTQNDGTFFSRFGCMKSSW